VREQPYARLLRVVKPRGLQWVSLTCYLFSQLTKSSSLRGSFTGTKKLQSADCGRLTGKPSRDTSSNFPLCRRHNSPNSNDMQYRIRLARRHCSPLPSRLNADAATPVVLTLTEVALIYRFPVGSEFEDTFGYINRRPLAMQMLSTLD
jgi:hypothetical protein